MRLRASEGVARTARELEAASTALPPAWENLAVRAQDREQEVALEVRDSEVAGSVLDSAEVDPVDREWVDLGWADQGRVDQSQVGALA